jgi:hypothetical protein
LTECDRVRADAAGLAALPPGDPDGAAARAHARGCVACAVALGEAERLHAVVGGWKPPPPSAGAFERASRSILAELRREARRRAVGSIAAVVASVAIVVGFARSRSASARDWWLAALLLAVAVAVAAIARRTPSLATGGAVAIAVAAAIASGRPGPLDPALGVECLATELAAAAAVIGAVWLALRGGTTSPAPWAVAAAAAAGALAGDAALQVTCAAHDAAPHVMAFHVGGVVVAAAAASLLWRSGRRAPA